MASANKLAEHGRLDQAERLYDLALDSAPPDPRAGLGLAYIEDSQHPDCTAPASAFGAPAHVTDAAAQAIRDELKSLVERKGRHLCRLMSLAGFGPGAGTRRWGRWVTVLGGAEVAAHEAIEGDQRAAGRLPGGVLGATSVHRPGLLSRFTSRIST
jgi:hypothetical protein